MLRLDGLSKSYASRPAVDAFSLQLGHAKTIALLGPSGCGKSTLLRLIAGLEVPDAGHLWLNHKEITAVPPQRRGFGMVFQDYALFPHLNVANNIAYGLVELGWSRARREQRVNDLLALVDLEAYAQRKVHELSGGEQQRIALARALAPEPTLLLLDEPLSNLDFTLREDLKHQLKELLDELAISAIYVTHDQSEAFALADDIAIMRSGRLEQLAPAQELFALPRTAWIASFLGHENVFSGHEWQTNSPYVLVRQDLLRLGVGERMAEVTASHVLADKQHLSLKLDSGQCLSWQGYHRELPEDIALGKRVRLEIPEAAVVALADV